MVIKKTKLSTITAVIATTAVMAITGIIGGIGQQQIALAQEEPVCTPEEWASDSFRCLQLLNTDETTAIRDDLDDLLEEALGSIPPEVLAPNPPDVPDCPFGQVPVPVFAPSGFVRFWLCIPVDDLGPSVD
jgi:hypothetical protein